MGITTCTSPDMHPDIQADSVGIAPFFLIDGLACLALDLVMYLPRSVRALDANLKGRTLKKNDVKS